MKKLTIILGMGVMLALAAGPARAEKTGAGQSEPQEPKVMEPVIVTAGRIAESQRAVTQAATVIPREEIAKNQYRDLGSMLRNYGFQYNNYSRNEGLGSVSIRGVRSSTLGDAEAGVLVLVDGRRIGTDNLAMIPMVNVERVEIIRGPASVQYGSSAIGGVINVITRRGPGQDATGENKEYAGKIEAGGGSWDTWKTQAELAAQGRGVDFSGGVSWLTAGDYKTGGGHTYHNTGNDYNLGYSVNMGYSFNPENRIGATMLGVRNEQAGSPNELQYNDRESYSDRNNYSMDFIYDGGYPGWGLSWLGRYYNGFDKYSSHDFNYGLYEREIHYQGVQGQTSWTRGFLTLTGGVDYLYTDNEIVSGTDETKSYNTGAFLLAKLSFLDELLIFSGGVRYDDYDLRYNGENADLHHTTPSVGMAVNPTNWLTFRANYGESFLTPQAQQLTGYPGYYGSYIGNPDLDPEEGKSWDAGAEINYKSLNLGLTYFQTNYENKIVTRAVPGTPDYQYYNLSGKTRYRGLEAQASYDLGALFDWPFILRPYFSMTTLFKFEDEEGANLEYVSRHNMAYGLNFDRADWGLMADLRFTYYGRQKQSAFDQVTYISTPVTVGPSTVVDLFITKSIYDFEEAGTLSIKGELRNLFDEDYDTVYGYPMPGRSYYIGLQYEF